MKILPIGVQDFVQLRQDDLLYVDKTAKLLDLIQNLFCVVTIPLICMMI